MKQVIIGVLAVVAIIGGAVIFGKDDQPASNGQPTSHIYGNKNASVTLVEYADFECPGCGGFYPVVSALKERYKDELRFEFRNFPLVNTHQNALAAHRAAEAADKQGKFWEMHNILFERQESWNGPSYSDPVGIPVGQAITVFESYAEELELNLDQFKEDLKSSEIASIINADIERGKNDDVTGTPTFFLDGQRIDDTSTIDTIEKFSALIDEALGKNSDSGSSADTDADQDDSALANTEENTSEDVPSTADTTSGE